MKKSKIVTLVLVTSTIFFGCEEDGYRNQYRSLSDCVDDYKDPLQCEKDYEASGIDGAFFYGPFIPYSHVSNPVYNPSVNSHRAVSTVRGGWGSTGSRSSS